MFAFTASKKLNDATALYKAEQHGMGRDDNAASRRLPDAPFRCYAWANLDGMGERWAPVTHKDAHKAKRMELRELYKAHLKRHQAVERKGAPKCLHMGIAVSPEWLSGNGGDPRDYDNPRVRAWLNAAHAWAEATIGGVFQMRLDVDERGAGWLDVFAAPIEPSRKKMVVSVNKPLARLREKHGQVKSYSAMQDSWAEWAQQRLDQRLERGAPKSVTGKVSLTPEEYRAAHDTANYILDLEKQNRGLQKQVRELTKKVDALERGELLSDEVGRSR